MKEKSFLRWLACFKNPYSSGDDCGDYNGVFYDCYMYANCDGLVDPIWHSCYWKGECEVETPDNDTDTETDKA